MKPSKEQHKVKVNMNGVTVIDIEGNNLEIVITVSQNPEVRIDKTLEKKPTGRCADTFVANKDTEKVAIEVPITTNVKKGELNLMILGNNNNIIIPEQISSNFDVELTIEGRGCTYQGESLSTRHNWHCMALNSNIAPRLKDVKKLTRRL